MSLRDYLITPREAAGPGEAARRGGAAGAREAVGPGEAARRGGAAGAREAAAARGAAGARSTVGSRDAAAAREIGDRGRFPFSRRGRQAPAASAELAPTLGVLANARDLPAVAIAVGLVVARRRPAALVCVHAPDAELRTPALRAPARPATTRLAASLRSRGLTAATRGYVAVVSLAPDDEDAAGAAARALAAAGALPTVLAVAARDPDLDVLLAAQDAILVALPPSAETSLAELAASSAARLAPRAESIALTLDPATRALALAGLRAPGAVRAAVEGLVA